VQGGMQSRLAGQGPGACKLAPARAAPPAAWGCCDVFSLAADGGCLAAAAPTMRWRCACKPELQRRTGSHSRTVTSSFWLIPGPVRVTKSLSTFLKKQPEIVYSVFPDETSTPESTPLVLLQRGNKRQGLGSGVCVWCEGKPGGRQGREGETEQNKQGSKATAGCALTLCPPPPHSCVPLAVPGC